MDKSVRMILEPNIRRQVDEEGLVVFWRDSREPTIREGLACTLSLCPHPECACGLVYVDGYRVDRKASAVVWDQDGVHFEGVRGEKDNRVTLEARVVAMVDPSSGDTRADPDLQDATDPELLEWLALEVDGDVLEVLHRYQARVKGYPPEGPRKDIDLDDVEQYHLVFVDEILEGTRVDEYLIGDRRYWGALQLCPTPWCDCHEAHVVFFDEELESGDAVGSVLIDISGQSGFGIKKKKSECGPKKLLEDLWALFEQRHDVGRFLRHREAQMKSVGDTLWHRVSKPVTAASKTGRNTPCPCGSGRKYKKCCLPRSH